MKINTCSLSQPESSLYKLRDHAVISTGSLISRLALLGELGKLTRPSLPDPRPQRLPLRERVVLDRLSGAPQRDHQLPSTGVQAIAGQQATAPNAPAPDPDPRIQRARAGRGVSHGIVETAHHTHGHCGVQRVHLTRRVPDGSEANRGAGALRARQGAPARGRAELRTRDRPAYVRVLREARAIGRARAVLAAHDVRKLVSADGERAHRARLPVGDAGAGSVVVDVAGNVGHCSIPIARANPAVKIVVQDLPKIVARGADPATSVIPAELRHRFTFMEHDFYAPQPVKGAAVYFLRMIMHDYSDAYCLKILRQIVPSMGPDSRIVVMDQVSPPVGLLPSAIERMMRTQDLQMMLLTNARERDVVEWRELVGSVVEDKGESGEPEQQERQEQNAVPGTTTTARKLEIKTIVSPQGGMMSLIEIGFVDEDAVTTNGAPETNS